MRMKRDLAELRRVRGRTQDDVAREAGWQQEAVSRLERSGDSAKLSTLRRYVEALGGELRLTAVFRGERHEVELEGKGRAR